MDRGEAREVALSAHDLPELKLRVLAGLPLGLRLGGGTRSCLHHHIQPSAIADLIVGVEAAAEGVATAAAPEEQEGEKDRSGPEASGSA